ncbi:MAG: galactokinase [Spirochaetes bacterium]|nr:galactokinase [Spirochaetota bacterium]
MNDKELIAKLKSRDFLKIISEMYGKDNKTFNIQKSRYMKVIENFCRYFNEYENIDLFTSPGRVELCGNHTDHNNGKVLGASINKDIIGAAGKCSNEIAIVSEGFKGVFKVNINDLKKNKDDNNTVLLIKGILKGFKDSDCKTGGFNAYITSDVLNASGISSSAAFEMLICTIINCFYNDNRIDLITLAKIGRFAENYYWEKPSGLLDQLTCGHGGIISIDFKNRENPQVSKINNIFRPNDYNVVLLNTGGNHADLTKEYASIPDEMKTVAKKLGGKTLSDIKEEKFYKNISALRKTCGDRALLRSFHFYEENKRVSEAVNAVKKNNMNDFLKIINDSGDSSWKLLQNCYISAEKKDQNIPIALTLTGLFLGAKSYPFACRVHGGGFAGVILIILPDKITGLYKNYIEKYFGKDSCMIMNIREQGALKINFK